MLDEISETLLLLEQSDSIISEQLEKAERENSEYDYWDGEFNRITAFMSKITAERRKNKLALASLQTQYAEVKKQKKQYLERSLTETLNTWYDGAKYDLEFKSKAAGSATHTYLIDKITGSDLDTVCGDSAVQVAGLLNLNAILSVKDSNFLFLDEAFSNTDAATAKQIADLLSTGINDIQVVVIENKTALSTRVNGLLYLLKFNEDKGQTEIIAIMDPKNEIVEIDKELYALKQCTRFTLEDVQDYLEDKEVV